MSQTAKELEENFKESEYPYEVHIYPGKGHAFMNSMILPDEDDAEVQLAWSRFKEWMTRYLYSWIVNQIVTMIAVKL